MADRRYIQLTEYPGKGAEKLLGELELEVMRIIWARRTVTVRDVLAVVTVTRPLAYTTVMTIMNRLVEKALLSVEKAGKTHRYHAAQTREEFEAQTVGQVVQSLIDDFGGELAISQFVEKLSAVDPNQLARLTELVRLAQEGQHEP